MLYWHVSMTFYLDMFLMLEIKLSHFRPITNIILTCFHDFYFILTCFSLEIWTASNTLVPLLHLIHFIILTCFHHFYFILTCFSLEIWTAFNTLVPLLHLIHFIILTCFHHFYFILTCFNHMLS